MRIGKGKDVRGCWTTIGNIDDAVGIQRKREQRLCLLQKVNRRGKWSKRAISLDVQSPSWRNATLEAVHRSTLPAWERQWTDRL
jgi:hypothetical protein